MILGIGTDILNAHQLADVKHIIISMNGMAANTGHTPTERIRLNSAVYKLSHKTPSLVNSLLFNSLTLRINLITYKLNATRALINYSFIIKLQMQLFSQESDNLTQSIYQLSLRAKQNKIVHVSYIIFNFQIMLNKSIKFIQV